MATATLRGTASLLCRRGVLAGGCVLGAAWAVDEVYGHRVGQRTLRALGTGARLFWEYKVRWTPENSSEVHDRVARSVVACLKGNEGLYVKFGQALASMEMILPDEYKRELKVLHDRAATFPFTEVKRVVEADLGSPLAEVFESFEEEPIASASIAQVHRARLHHGIAEGTSAAERTVAVKVQKPNIPVQNRCDLAIFHLLLVSLEWAFDLPLAWTYDYTRQQLEAELDFRVEADNAERCARDLRASSRLRDRVVVPRVFREVSGQHVLVMEWVDCISPVNDKAALAQAGLIPSEVMQVAVETFGHQIFSTGHIHCDPHPGNLLVRRLPTQHSSGWQLVLLDHGLYCELPDKLRQEYAEFWVATALGDRQAAVDLCRGWGVADEEASELLASITQFRRVRFSAGRMGMVASLFGKSTIKAKGGAAGTGTATASPGHAHEHGHGRPPRRKLTPEEAAAAQAAIKERVRKVLGDTRAFPQQLLFVGRNLNMIRSANFSLGTVVNRVAVLARCAAEGAAVRRGAVGNRAWLLRSLALFRFHLTVNMLLLAEKLALGWLQCVAAVAKLKNFWARPAGCEAVESAS